MHGAIVQGISELNEGGAIVKGYRLKSHPCEACKKYRLSFYALCEKCREVWQGPLLKWDRPVHKLKK